MHHQKSMQVISYSLFILEDEKGGCLLIKDIQIYEILKIYARHMDLTRGKLKCVIL